ncbi:hypothetical protein SELMODRAFT_403456 [Selaginella moellendorffii]|uniref:Plant heme peroxidase family profile domain-containing protein n=1 Tax=Selaginella moellendorffii TaxID=88036 RepID=D8QRG9_SELML|nr:peroxidase 29 [Selaginella moellendorffii]EFJ36776.1 hypothetical protein SELMODRAFT_403456 [Selaginella moellendorffii]|eukprot:XP_002961516.1 peroxidase 29 [Selaginella moellendorffii]
MKRKAQDAEIPMLDDLEDEVQGDGWEYEGGLACPPWDPEALKSFCAMEDWCGEPVMARVKPKEPANKPKISSNPERPETLSKPSSSEPKRPKTPSEPKRPNISSEPKRPKTSSEPKRAKASKSCGGEAKTRKNASAKVTPELRALLAKVRATLPEQIDCPWCGRIWCTRFYDFNNHKPGQPRYHCKPCKRTWTKDKGCDASILLDSKGSIKSERDSDKNFGIRRLDFIDRIKLMLEAACPGVVSCADIIVLVARESIVFTRGPTIPMLTGRRDSTAASNAAADRLLPPATVSVDNFISLFASKGLSLDESVAIIGAHTIGVGHCVNIVNRLYPNQDSKISLLFASRLRVQCPTANPWMLNNITVINNDMTNLVFDNQYFRDLIARFSTNQQLFLNTFSSAFVKLTSSNVLTGQSGQVRKYCHSVN